jgi:hypothetical protein
MKKETIEEKEPQREECSYLKGHEKPTEASFRQDLCNWWEEYACRGEYKSINDVIHALGRLKDYMGEHEGYEFDDALSEDDKIHIIWRMLRKVTKALNNVPRHMREQECIKK